MSAATSEIRIPMRRDGAWGAAGALTRAAFLGSLGGWKCRARRDWFPDPAGYGGMHGATQVELWPPEYGQPLPPLLAAEVAYIRDLGGEVLMHLYPTADDV